MRFPLDALLALRFLRSKKSHGAVSAVAGVSIAGVAVATAAIVCVLSVFNGFRETLTDKLDALTPDITVTPAGGKTIHDGDSLARVLRALPGVKAALPVVEDQALALYEGSEMPVRLKGIDIDAYRSVTALDSLTVAPAAAGDRATYPGERGRAIASIGTAVGLGSPAPGDSLLIFAPKRYGRLNPANPLASFLTDSVRLAAVYEAQQNDFDKNTLIVPVEVARDIFQYDSEATGIEVTALPGADLDRLRGDVEKAAGSGLKVKDRLESHETNFRMVKIEKWVTYLLLFFILIVAGFNIISTMSMLVLEKQRQLHTLRALGLSSRRIGGVFAWESFYVALTGGVAGIISGLALCLVQQEFGLLKFSGDRSDLILASYPVKVLPIDLLWALLPVLAIGAMTALSAASFAQRRS